MYGAVESMKMNVSNFLYSIRPKQASESIVRRVVPDFKNRNMWGDGDADGGEPRRGRMVQAQLNTTSLHSPVLILTP